jgi:DNA-directed RNA polymerase subunit M/transcription elongation factor TFIIS
MNNNNNNKKKIVLQEDEEGYFSEAATLISDRKQKRLKIAKTSRDPIDSLLTCRRCHKKTTSYRLVQTRSMDEGMSAIYTCRTCQAQWK